MSVLLAAASMLAADVGLDHGGSGDAGAGHALELCMVLTERISIAAVLLETDVDVVCGMELRMKNGAHAAPGHLQLFVVHGASTLRTF